MESPQTYAVLLHSDVYSTDKLTDILLVLVPRYEILQYQDCTDKTLLDGFGTHVGPTYLASSGNLHELQPEWLRTYMLRAFSMYTH